MKRNKSILFIILSVLFTLVISGCLSVDTSVLPEDERYVQYVLDFPGVPSEALYKNAYTLFRNESYTRFEGDSINMNRLIASKSVGVTYGLVPVKTDYNLIIDIKDEKCRLTYRDLYRHIEVAPGPVYAKCDLDAFKKESDKLVAEFQAKMIYYLTKPTKASDDW